MAEDHARDVEVVQQVEDPYTYLRAAIITLGVAAGIVVVAWFGRFDTAVNSVLSVALFPVVLGIAFFLVYLAISLLRDRYASVKGIITLVLIAILLLMFPVLYVPGAPLAIQMQRLAIIPIAVAIAALASYFIVRWLDDHPQVYHRSARRREAA